MVHFVGKSLYHYTNEVGLKGIFSPNDPEIHDEIHIRFSTASRFSDKSEGKHTIDLLHEVCRDFFANKESEKELHKATQGITSLEESFIIHAGDINDAPTDILPRMAPIVIDYGRVETFIACFSENEDNQSLWDIEGKYNTFAIEFFDQSFFQPWLPNGFSGETPYEIRFEKVIYDDAEKKKKILEDLRDLYQQYSANKGEFIDSLKASLSEYQYLFKKYEKYHKEAETRAIIKVDNLNRLSENGIKTDTFSDGKCIYIPMCREMVHSVRIRSDVADADVTALTEIARECMPNTTVLFKGRPI